MLIFGGEGADSIRTGNGNNTVYGGTGQNASTLDGADVITTGAGSDLIYAGFNGAGANNSINAGDGNNTVVGGFDSADGGDCIITGSGDDLIFGNGGNDILDLGGGNGTVIGGFGNDQLTNSGAHGAILAFGNEGDDVISFGNTSHTIFGGIGDDVVFAGSTGVIYGGEGYDNVFTYIVPAGPNTVYGGSDSSPDGGGGDNVDNIATGEGNDLIFGGNGDDTIGGREEADTQYGGVGADRFLINLIIRGDGVAGNDRTTVDFIADLAWGSDIIVSGTNAGAVDTVSAASQAAIEAAPTLALAAAIAANDITVGDIGTFAYQGDTYLLQDLSTEAFVDADDLLVRITGATGIITAASVRAHRLLEIRD